MRRVLDGLAFASLIPAGVAPLLLLAAGAALGQPPDWLAAGLAASGTFFVYGVDRLRGVEADRAKAPERTDFVERHRKPLGAATAAAGIVAAALVVALPRDVQLLCAAVAVAGLLHRRLKRFAIAKPLYVTSAWLAITAGIPALSGADPGRSAWVASIYAAALGANLLTSNGRPKSALLLGLSGAAAALLAPTPVMHLAAVPVCQLAALAGRRGEERFFLLELDAALLVGAALALALG